ncbi:hypothetical protein ACE6H2_018148 [Prunus campanulata]
MSSFSDTMCAVWNPGWNLQSSLFKEMGFRLVGNLCPPFLGKFRFLFRVIDTVTEGGLKSCFSFFCLLLNFIALRLFSPFGNF